MRSSLTDAFPDAPALLIMILISSNETLLRKSFIVPIEAALIDKFLKPIADKANASKGLPASSPQKLRGVLNFSHRWITDLIKCK